MSWDWISIEKRALKELKPEAGPRSLTWRGLKKVMQIRSPSQRANKVKESNVSNVFDESRDAFYSNTDTINRNIIHCIELAQAFKVLSYPSVPCGHSDAQPEMHYATG